MKFIKWFCIILLCWLSWIPLAQATVNLPEKIVEARKDEPKVRIPDWEQISFSDLPVMEESGSVSLEGLGEDLTWSSGTKISEILNLETISDLSPEKLSIHAITNKIGLPESQATEILLRKFPLVQSQTFDDLLDGVIGLNDTSLGEFTPLADFLVKGDVPVLDTLLGGGRVEEELQSLAEDLGISDLNDLNLGQLESEILISLDSLPVAEAVELLNLGELELSDLERIATELGVEDFSIGDYSLEDIPGLVDSPVESLANWGWEKIKDIPLLEDLPLSLMPNPIDILGGFVARVDMVWAESESSAPRTVSGGNQVGFEVPCEEKPCGAIELDDITSLGRQLQMEFEGKRWVAGDSQEVEGGKNCLKFVNGGKEPTGRHPFGSSFKLVAWNPDETGTQNIDFVAFFRFCFPCGPFGSTGCTPYFIGPIPLMGGFSQNDYVLLGKLDGEGGQTAPLPRPDIPIPEGATVGSPSERTPSNPCQGKVVPPSELDSVLSGVVATMESNGDPTVIGVYGCDGESCGRELGLYSLHTTDQKVRERIESRDGGAEWLSKVDNGKKVTKNDIEQYFPPTDQEAVFRELVNESVSNFNESDADDAWGVRNFLDDWLGGEAADHDLFEGLSQDLMEVADLETQRRGCNLSDLNLGECEQSLIKQATAIGGNTVTNPASQALPLILKEAEAAGLSQDQVAYVLASAQHESVMGVHVTEIPEGDPVAYFNQKYSHRTDLGNQGGNDGYNYRGRGYVQITGRLNYQRYTDLSEELFGEYIDFIANPDRVAEPEIAAKILVHGMKNGTFTGVGLDNYINENQTDFYNARRIVNGTDRAQLIAGYAQQFDTVLNNCAVSGEATGRWIHPAPGYGINSGYGPRSGCSICSSNHKGVDFPTPTGTAILASDGGVVFQASPASGYGNTVIIHHPNGLYTLYAHLSSFNVYPGQKVAQGDVLGQSGNTGNSTGPHLHFEFIQSGSNPFRNARINPEQFIDFN